MLSLDLQVGTTRLDNYLMLSIFEMFSNDLFSSFKFSLLEIEKTKTSNNNTNGIGISIIADMF